MKYNLFLATFIDGPLHQQKLSVATGQMILECIEVQGSIEIKHFYEAVPNSARFKYWGRK